MVLGAPRQYGCYDLVPLEEVRETHLKSDRRKALDPVVSSMAPIETYQIILHSSKTSVSAMAEHGHDGVVRVVCQ